MAQNGRMSQQRFISLWERVDNAIAVQVIVEVIIAICLLIYGERTINDRVPDS